MGCGDDVDGTEPGCEWPLYGGDDFDFLSGLEEERNNLSAPPVNYYSLNRGQNVDPLYGEPTTWGFRDVVVIRATFEFQETENKTTQVREDGVENTYDGVLYISRLEWELKVPDRSPKAGDVIQVHNKAFDVVFAGEGGYVVNSAEYVGWKLNLRKLSQFDPSRKLP